MLAIIKNKLYLIGPMDRAKIRLGQSVLEYTILISVVAAALLAMSLYVRRAIQANLKTIEYQINLESNTTN